MTSLQEIIAKTVQDTGLLYTAIGNIGNTVLGALYWFILASMVKVAEYGEVNYIIATAVIPATLGIIGLNTTVTTFLAKGYRNILYESNSIVLMSSVIVALAVYLIYGVEPAIVSVSLMYFTMSIAQLVGEKKFREYAFTILLERITQIVTSITLYLVLGIMGIIIGYALGPLLASQRFYRSLTGFTLKVTQLKEKIMFTFHSYGLMLTNTFSMYLDKLIIGYLFGFTVLGFYQLSYQFLMLIMVIPGILFTYLLPQEASGLDRREVKYLGLGISILITLALILGAPILIPILFPSYSNSIILIQIMGISIIPITITALINARLLGHEKSMLALGGGIIYLLFLIALLPILGFVLGPTGLALAVVLSSFARAGYLAIKVNLRI